MDVRLWRLQSTLRHDIVAASQRHGERSHLLVEIHSDGVTGMGEVSPQPTLLNGDPDEKLVLDHVTAAIEQLVSDPRDGGWPQRSIRVDDDPAEVDPSVNVDAAARLMSSSCLQMALLDWWFVAQRWSWSSWWPTVRHNVGELATWSLIEPDSSWSPPEGAQRLRVKTAGGVDLANVVSILATWHTPVLLDFNCSATSDDDVVRQVEEISRVVEVVAVEQPYGINEWNRHRVIAQKLPVPLSLDESIRTIDDVRRASELGARAMVCVKSARVGGVLRAASLLELARTSGLRYYVGGFFELPLGRRVNHALACATMAEASDVAPVAIREGSDAPTGGLDDVGVGAHPSLDSAALLGSWRSPNEPLL